jgi:hypothetical protein
MALKSMSVEKLKDLSSKVEAAIRQKGTSNNGAFFVGSTTAAARRSFFALDLA